VAKLAYGYNIRDMDFSLLSISHTLAWIIIPHIIRSIVLSYCNQKFNIKNILLQSLLSWSFICLFHFILNYYPDELDNIYYFLNFFYLNVVALSNLNIILSNNGVFLSAPSNPSGIGSSTGNSSTQIPSAGASGTQNVPGPAPAPASAPAPAAPAPAPAPAAPLNPGALNVPLNTPLNLGPNNPDRQITSGLIVPTTQDSRWGKDFTDLYTRYMKGEPNIPVPTDTRKLYILAEIQRSLPQITKPSPKLGDVLAEIEKRLGYQYEYDLSCEINKIVRANRDTFPNNISNSDGILWDRLHIGPRSKIIKCLKGEL